MGGGGGKEGVEGCSDHVIACCLGGADKYRVYMRSWILVVVFRFYLHKKNSQEGISPKLCSDRGVLVPIFLRHVYML